MSGTRDDQKTVVARVDPETGQVIAFGAAVEQSAPMAKSVPPKPAGKGSATVIASPKQPLLKEAPPMLGSDRRDATVVVGNFRPQVPLEVKAQASVVPRNKDGKDGGETVFWRGGVPKATASSGGAVYKQLGKAGGKRVVIWGSVVLAVSGVLLLIAGRHGAGQGGGSSTVSPRPFTASMAVSRDPESEIAAPRGARDVEAARPSMVSDSSESRARTSLNLTRPPLGPPPTPIVPLTTRAVGAAGLKAAADALIAGRMEEAIERYRALARRHPGEPSYRLTVEILVHQGGEQ